MKKVLEIMRITSHVLRSSWYALRTSVYALRNWPNIILGLVVALGLGFGPWALRVRLLNGGIVFGIGLLLGLGYGVFVIGPRGPNGFGRLWSQWA